MEVEKGLTTDREDTCLQIMRADGQQMCYLVLSPEERQKGFERPVRLSYRHLRCGHVTTMARAIAETYARDHLFYTGTFCVACEAHYPLFQDMVKREGANFVWVQDETAVGG